ncbi:MAG TPA: LPS export ABC transporter periplasmic protein LptC [Azospirillaceae bacterium]|nr:LPS export ABC transporter periplasmic protein LptC [Azospirillaceae bacterium]
MTAPASHDSDAIPAADPAGGRAAAALPAPPPRAYSHAHTRYVAIAKVALPALAGVVIAAMALWPLVQETTLPRTAGPESGQLEMVDARYMGTDRSERPFEVRAARAIQGTGPGKEVDLVGPQAEITLKGGDWVTVSAERGRYDQASGRLSLAGDVTLFHDEGYEFRTEDVQVDTGQGLAWGNARVTGQGPFGDIDAGGFRILEDGKTIVFTGKARLRLAGDRIGGSKPAAAGTTPQEDAAPAAGVSPGGGR